MKHLLYIFLIFTIISCVGRGTDSTESVASDSDSIERIVTIVDTTISHQEADSTIANLSPQQKDSLYFRLTHHYSENFNFLVKVDSMELLPRNGDLLPDTCRVYRGDVVVVAAIQQEVDTVWVKVAHDQMTMGWINEKDLLRNTTPDDSISEILAMLTDSRGVWMSALIVIALFTYLIRRSKDGQLQILKFDEMRSPYPLIFLALIAIMASTYASIQNFVPEYWQEYYFHPTLNPFNLPLIMAFLVTLVWMVIIIFIAVCDEVYHHFFFLPGMSYLIELLGLGMITYLVIGWSTLYYIGYILLVAYIVGMVSIFWTYIKH